MSAHIEPPTRTKRTTKFGLEGFRPGHRWPVERWWTVHERDGTTRRLQTSGLREYRACCLLGAAGLGKTYELAHLAELESEAGREVRIARLAALGQNPDGLISKLGSIASGLTSDTVIYLDALDEVMIPVRQGGLILSTWIGDAIADSDASVRISCRSAIWPNVVDSALESAFGTERFVVAVLEPLSDEDVQAIAAESEVEPGDFLRSVERAGVRTLSQQPLTLEMLLRIHSKFGRLPESRKTLFGQAIDLLADEQMERREQGTAADVPHSEVVEAAERLACYLLFSGKDTVDIGDAPSGMALGRRELQRLRDDGRPLSDRILDAVRRSGLCTSDGTAEFRFAHRQLAEYLAGRRVAKLLLHQARSLLSAGEDWHAGVAGPLRETAAFAAMESQPIAAWVTECDSEVIGLSDVADNALRKQAAANLLARFRRQEMTDTQINRGDGVELKGFQYPGAEADLKSVLAERQSGCADVLECAIEFVKSWELDSMGDELAALMLDPGAPLQAREAAGYALVKHGSATAKHRVLPLVTGHSDDPDFDLKGLALECNWPERMTVPALFAALVPARRNNYHGAYHGFLLKLETDGFSAAGFRQAGLTWALQFISEADGLSFPSRIAKNIAKAALDELADPGIAEALATLILKSAKAHVESPLLPRTQYGSDDTAAVSETPLLADRKVIRRALIDALARHTTDDAAMWWAARETPGLLQVDDFVWLLDQAVADHVPMPARSNYAALARMLPWHNRAECIDAWLQHRTVEPVASHFPYPIVTVLGSDEARTAKREYDEMKRDQRKSRPKKHRSPPAERVEQALSASESKDPKFFHNLCRELTLTEESEFYQSERFLTLTPGWVRANEGDRRRMIEAAKRFLEGETEIQEGCRTISLQSGLIGHMAAILLLFEQEREWLLSQPTSWWERWTWYILREFHPLLSEEPTEPKEELFRHLHERAARQVRKEFEQLATATIPQSWNILGGLLSLFNSIEDEELDQTLCDHLQHGRIQADLVSDVAGFILSRSSGRALPACEACITESAVAASSERAVAAAIALGQMRLVESWSAVHDLLQRRPDLAGQILSGLTDGRRPRRLIESGRSSFAMMSAEQLVQLILLLFEHFPPEADPQHEGAHAYTAEDAGRELRDGLVNALGARRDLVAVTALRALEKRIGGKYDWLRRPRAAAERAYRIATWTPVSPSAVAELLTAREKRLIRSPSDALDGIVAAIKHYEQGLRHGRPNDLEDFWNRQPKGLPYPKEEERVSDKVRDAIVTYFADYAVAAEREVQLFRRKLPDSAGGAPGSEVDVFCTVPATSTVSFEPIALPIEVKLANNREARTGLKTQLVDRYIRERGADGGAFVVAWMGLQVPAAYRPLWKTPAEAEAELADQAARTVGVIDVRTVVMDLSLPLAPTPKKRVAGKGKGSRAKTPKKKASPRAPKKPAAAKVARKKPAAKKHAKKVAPKKKPPKTRTS